MLFFINLDCLNAFRCTLDFPFLWCKHFCNITTICSKSVRYLSSYVLSFVVQPALWRFSFSFGLEFQVLFYCLSKKGFAVVSFELFAKFLAWLLIFWLSFGAYET